jgi:hypothetical protein
MILINIRYLPLGKRGNPSLAMFRICFRTYTEIQRYKIEQSVSLFFYIQGKHITVYSSGRNPTARSKS